VTPVCFSYTDAIADLPGRHSGAHGAHDLVGEHDRAKGISELFEEGRRASATAATPEPVADLDGLSPVARVFHGRERSPRA
jgi:hypothetical protein